MGRSTNKFSLLVESWQPGVEPGSEATDDDGEINCREFLTSSFNGIV